MELPDAMRRILRDKVTRILLLISVITLVVIAAQDSLIAALGTIGVILVSLASAVFVAALVSMAFEWLTRAEMTQLVEAIVKRSEERILAKVLSLPDTSSPLSYLWRPFVIEDTEIFVPQDLSGQDVEHVSDYVIRTADMIAAIELYEELLARFYGLLPFSEIRIRVNAGIKKRETPKFTWQHHMIVIGAPGANPLATLILSRVKGIEDTVQNGYVFQVSPSRYYLQSPFIAEVQNEDEVGIADMKDGREVRLFGRHRVDDPFSVANEDCAVIFRGRTELASNLTRRFVIFAGHSRASTLEIVKFATQNEEWAQRIIAYEENGKHNTETLLRFRWDRGIPCVLSYDIRETVAKRA